jgi:uncharacterized protein YjiS (DUF1127 family)
MTEQWLSTPIGPAPTSNASLLAAGGAQPPAGLLSDLASQFVSWRQRARHAREFRGFDPHQLRDLGLSPFDQW